MGQGAAGGRPGNKVSAGYEVFLTGGKPGLV